MNFNPNEHIIKINAKGGMKDYLTVQWRLVWFREQFPHGVISTEMLHLDSERGLAVFKASIDDGEGGHSEGHGSETSRDFGDFLEKAETKAIGRALAALGFGTQFAPELEEGERIVDSPVERKPTTATRQSQPQQVQATNVTEQQLASIRKLSDTLNKALPDTLATYSYSDASKLIQQLSAEYRDQRKAS